MRAFHYKLGHEACTTMTVIELREALKSYPDDIPVFETWEGIYIAVDKDSFLIEEVDKGDSSENCPCLIINVDEF